ncbi:hypothetical protein B0H14DRAFT_3170880 [Mycena olivaceomarginata]|nr:hypothetical protein B0H14DRAFT_3170880 [Mycena olivaceomarginata]
MLSTVHIGLRGAFNDSGAAGRKVSRGVINEAEIDGKQRRGGQAKSAGGERQTVGGASRYGPPRPPDGTITHRMQSQSPLLLAARVHFPTKRSCWHTTHQDTVPNGVELTALLPLVNSAIAVHNSRFGLDVYVGWDRKKGDVSFFPWRRKGERKEQRKGRKEERAHFDAQRKCRSLSNFAGPDEIRHAYRTFAIRAEAHPRAMHPPSGAISEPPIACASSPGRWAHSPSLSHGFSERGRYTWWSTVQPRTRSSRLFAAPQTRILFPTQTSILRLCNRNRNRTPQRRELGERKNDDVRRKPIKQGLNHSPHEVPVPQMQWQCRRVFDTFVHLTSRWKSRLQTILIVSIGIAARPSSTLGRKRADSEGEVGQERGDCLHMRGACRPQSCFRTSMKRLLQGGLSSVGSERESVDRGGEKGTMWRCSDQCGVASPFALATTSSSLDDSPIYPQLRCNSNDTAFGEVFIDSPKESSVSSLDIATNWVVTSYNPGSDQPQSVQLGQITIRILAYCSKSLSDSECSHVMIGGAAHTIVKMPDNCGRAHMPALPASLRTRIRIFSLLTIGRRSPPQSKYFAAIPASNGPIYMRADVTDMPDYWDTVVESPPERKGCSRSAGLRSAGLNSVDGVVSQTGCRFSKMTTVERDTSVSRNFHWSDTWTIFHKEVACPGNGGPLPQPHMSPSPPTPRRTGKFTLEGEAVAQYDSSNIQFASFGFPGLYYPGLLTGRFKTFLDSSFVIRTKTDPDVVSTAVPPARRLRKRAPLLRRGIMLSWQASRIGNDKWISCSSSCTGRPGDPSIHVVPAIRLGISVLGGAVIDAQASVRINGSVSNAICFTSVSEEVTINDRSVRQIEIFGGSIPDIQPSSFGPAYLEQKNATHSQKSCLVSLTTLDDAFERRSFEDELDTLWDSPDASRAILFDLQNPIAANFGLTFSNAQQPCTRRQGYDLWARSHIRDPVSDLMSNLATRTSMWQLLYLAHQRGRKERETHPHIKDGSKLHCLPYNARITGSNPFRPWLEVVANGIKANTIHGNSLASANLEEVYFHKNVVCYVIRRVATALKRGRMEGRRRNNERVSPWFAPRAWSSCGGTPFFATMFVVTIEVLLEVPRPNARHATSTAGVNRHLPPLPSPPWSPMLAPSQRVKLALRPRYPARVHVVRFRELLVLFSIDLRLNSGRTSTLDPELIFGTARVEHDPHRLEMFVERLHSRMSAGAAGKSVLPLRRRCSFHSTDGLFDIPCAPRVSPEKGAEPTASHRQTHAAKRSISVTRNIPIPDTPPAVRSHSSL